MGKLICFELKKAVMSRFFLVVFCLAVLADFLLQCGIQQYQDYLEGFKVVDQEVAALAEKETFFEYVGGERKATGFMLKSYDFIASMTDEERADVEAALKEKYGEDVLTDYVFSMSEEMCAVPGCFDFMSDLDYLVLTADLDSFNSSAAGKLGAVLKSAETFKKEAEEDGDAFGVRRNQEILRLYSKPRGKVTSIARHAEDSLFGAPDMLFVFLIVLLTSAVSVAGEHDRRTWLLLHTSKDGKGKTLLAKYLSGWLIGAGSTAAFRAVSLAALSFRGGTLGAGQPATALEKLVLCPYPMLIWQYALLSAGCQIFTAVILSTILTTVSALSKNGVVAYTFGSLVLGGSLLLLYFPPKSEWLAGPLALAEPSRYFSSYHVCDLFGVPVPWAVVHIAAWACFAAVFSLAADRVYHRKRGVI